MLQWQIATDEFGVRWCITVESLRLAYQILERQTDRGFVQQLGSNRTFWSRRTSRKPVHNVVEPGLKDLESIPCGTASLDWDIETFGNIKFAVHWMFVQGHTYWADETDFLDLPIWWRRHQPSRIQGSDVSFFEAGQEEDPISVTHSPHFIATSSWMIFLSAFLLRHYSDKGYILRWIVGSAHVGATHWNIE